VLVQCFSVACLAAALSAPAQSSTYHPAKARRHFVSISYDWQYTHPLGFGTHPVADLLGRPVREVHLETFNYQTDDGATKVHVLNFGNRGNGIGVTLYPFGSSQGTTLAIRGSIEQLPSIHLAFDGPAPSPSYLLTGGRAYDVGVGVDMSDRSPGWGLGSHAFVLGGIGRAHTDQTDGSRYFAEGGGGLSVGPVGVDFSVKIATNRWTVPVPHRFLTIPVSVRGTLTF
jgi:hypothetical protein